MDRPGHGLLGGHDVGSEGPFKEGRISAHSSEVQLPPFALIVDDRDQPVHGAHVEIFVDGEQVASGISDEAGIFRFGLVSSRPAWIWAKAGERIGNAVRSPRSSPNPGADHEDSPPSIDPTPTEMDARSSAPPTPVQLQLGAVVRGRVVHGVDQSPFGEVGVLALDVTAMRGPRPEWFNTGPPLSVGRLVQASTQGHFEFRGLAPGAPYALVVAGRGHVGSVRSAPLVASPSPAGPDLEIEVLPVFGVDIFLHEGASGRPFPPDTPAQLATVLANFPGTPESTVWARVAAGGGDKRSRTDGLPPHFTFARRVATLDLAPIDFDLDLRMFDFEPLHVRVELPFIGPGYPERILTLVPSPGGVQELTVRFLGQAACPSSGATAPAGQLFLKGEDGRTRSLFVGPDEEELVRLILARGRYEVRFAGDGDRMFLPGPSPDDFSIVNLYDEPVTLDWIWPEPKRTLWIDIVDGRSRPFAGMAGIQFAREDRVTPPHTENGGGFAVRGGEAVVLVRPPYVLRDIPPARYWFWPGPPSPSTGILVDLSGPETTHRIELRIPRSSGPWR